MRTGSNRLDLIFATPGFRPEVATTAYESKPNFRLQKVLGSPDSCEDFLETLLEIFHTDNQFKDIALLNLLCAPRIKGAEDLDIPRCLDWLDGLTRHVKGAIDRNIHNYRNDRDYGDCLPKWLMFILVSVIKKQYGATYNPVIKANKSANKISPMDNARDVFLNGLLDEDRKHRHGTCASFPVLVAAIARRLNYPVRLAVAGRHILARWDGDGVRFNIESTGPTGMVIHTDDYYRAEHVPDEYKDSAYFLRTLMFQTTTGWHKLGEFYVDGSGDRKHPFYDGETALYDGESTFEDVPGSLLDQFPNATLSRVIADDYLVSDSGEVLYHIHWENDAYANGDIDYENVSGERVDGLPNWASGETLPLGYKDGDGKVELPGYLNPVGEASRWRNVDE